MSSTIYVGGSSKGVGKTFVALGLLHLLAQNYKTGAWKPVDVGQVDYNAGDRLTDGERLQQVSGMQEHINFINPFMLNEDLPPVLAARRDGVHVKSSLLDQYFEILCQRFEYLVIEGGRSLHTPFTETETELECLSKWQPKILWVTNLGERELSETLLQIHTLKEAQLQIVGIILSNRENLKHGGATHYQWLTLEEQLSVRVLALLPYLETGLEEVSAIGNLLSQHFDADYRDLLGT